MAKPVTESSRIFLVHGHDESAKHETARYLERITGSDVVILHEQANRGRTLIEKFEHHAGEASYAVVLLTADDQGQSRDAAAMSARARQNVIFELGFIFGKLGREFVAVLHEESVELPTDIDGLVYIPIDSRGAWKTKLAKELSEAGFQIDAQKAL